MEATEPTLNTLAGYGFAFGLAGILIAGVLWKISVGGGAGVGAMVLPHFLGGSIIFSMITGVVWWATRP
jgi:hypothetical protein